VAGYKKHIFICENKRDPETGRVSCGQHQTLQFKAYLKERLKEKGLHRLCIVSTVPTVWDIVNTDQPWSFSRPVSGTGRPVLRP